jgi:hypothetical protein
MLKNLKRDNKVEASGLEWDLTGIGDAAAGIPIPTVRLNDAIVTEIECSYRMHHL